MTRLRLALLLAVVAAGLLPAAADARVPSCPDQVCFYDDAQLAKQLQSLDCPRGPETAATRAAWSRRANRLVRNRTRGNTSGMANGCRGAVRLTALDGSGETILFGHSIDSYAGTAMDNRRFRIEMPAWDVPGGQPEPRHVRQRPL